MPFFSDMCFHRLSPMLIQLAEWTRWNCMFCHLWEFFIKQDLEWIWFPNSHFQLNSYSMSDIQAFCYQVLKKLKGCLLSFVWILCLAGIFKERLSAQSKLDCSLYFKHISQHILKESKDLLASDFQFVLVIILERMLNFFNYLYLFEIDHRYFLFHFDWVAFLIQ